uniref:Uncharacterized protein n=1 Tax=Vitis vinifera TaxID=29760 RepID=F6HUA5_VITVI
MVNFLDFAKASSVPADRECVSSKLVFCRFSFGLHPVAGFEQGNREERCLVLVTHLGSHPVAHLGLNQFLGRPIMLLPILLPLNPLVVQPLLAHRLGVPYLVALQLVCLVQPNLLPHCLPQQHLALLHHRLLEVQCLLLELLQLLLLVVHHHHLAKESVERE